MTDVKKDETKQNAKVDVKTEEKVKKEEKAKEETAPSDSGCCGSCH